MKFFFDENFPKVAKELLIGRGHECYDPRGTSLESAADFQRFIMKHDLTKIQFNSYPIKNHVITSAHTSSKLLR